MKKLNLLFVFGLIFFTSFSEVNKNFKPKNVYETYDMIAEVYNTNFSTSANVSVDYNNQAVNLGVNSSYSGYYVDYYSSGSVKAIKNFKNGKLEGDLFFYSSAGTLEKIASYKNGSLSVDVKLKNMNSAAKNNQTVEAKLVDADGREVFRKTIKKPTL